MARDADARGKGARQRRPPTGLPPKVRTGKPAKRTSGGSRKPPSSGREPSKAATRSRHELANLSIALDVALASIILIGLAVFAGFVVEWAKEGQLAEYFEGVGVLSALVGSLTFLVAQGLFLRVPPDSGARPYVVAAIVLIVVSIAIGFFSPTDLDQVFLLGTLVTVCQLTSLLFYFIALLELAKYLNDLSARHHAESLVTMFVVLTGCICTVFGVGMLPPGPLLLIVPLVALAMVVAGLFMLLRFVQTVLDLRNALPASAQDYTPYILGGTAVVVGLLLIVAPYT